MSNHIIHTRLKKQGTRPTVNMQLSGFAYDKEVIGVGILGATGTVGQRFIQLLENHPMFEVRRLGASPRSAGKNYEDAVNWKLASQVPSRIKTIIVSACDPEHFIGCKVIFSGAF